MKLVKLSLLATSVLAGTFVSSAHAQVTDPSAALKGIGATSIQILVQQELNCLDGPNSPGQQPTYNSAGAPITVAEASYNSSTKPLVCANTGAQPNVSGKYVGVGSGKGRAAWENYTGFSAFTDGTPAWSNVHFAFSDGVLGLSDITAFNSGAQTHAVGNPIEIPLYTLPIAIAYEGEYGVTGGGTALNFNVKTTYRNAQGGLRLSRANYCNIFNGVTQNWNDASLKASNGNQSLMDPNDSASRWATDGVPIRLVGRADSSGTTDIFARHLSVVCGADVDSGGSNHYQQHAGGLPYDASINLLNVDSNTTYKGTFSTTGYANSTQDAAHMLLSGAYFDGTSINTTDGSETPGKFLVADGSSKVAGAISLAPDQPSPSLNSTLLNGKIGYIGTDFITPVNGSTLFAAALPQNNTTTFVMPSAKNAALALTELPPQSSSTGVYSTADTRTVPNASSGTQEPVDRANPLHWTAVLYSAQISGQPPQPTLANPVKGYPITGTTQMLPYQCFASASTRIAVTNFVAMVTGKATKEAFTAYDPLSFTNTSTTTPGITVQAGIAPMPAAWNTAISQTFLLKSTEASGGNTLGQIVQTYDSSRQGYYTSAGTGGHGLWIQSAIPATQATLNSATSNGNCTAGSGAAS